MSALVADTHAVIWYVLNSPLLSARARQAMERATRSGLPIFVSSITLVEIAYLVEKGRVPTDMLARVLQALKNDRSALVLAPLDLAIAETLPQVSPCKSPTCPIASLRQQRCITSYRWSREMQRSGLRELTRSGSSSSGATSVQVGASYPLKGQA